MLRQLSVIGRAAVRARRRADEETLGREALEALRAELPAEGVVSATFVDVPAGRAPWEHPSIDVRAGDEVSTFAVGRVYLSRLLNLYADAGAALWFRVTPGGAIFRGTRDTHTFTGEAGGTLELATHPPGDWTDRHGGHKAMRGEHAMASGAVSVLVVRWAPGVDSSAVLGELRSPLAAAELDRRASAVSVPDGWDYLWRVGDAEIYRSDDGAMCCRTERDVGILRRPVDEPLTESTRLRWSWRVDELPSGLAEDTLPTHDYLSIALEFDNGQDLSWHWSAELPEGYSYRCPLPHWRGRETHMVVRSGTADLGRWVDEERPVRADYETAIGTPPQRIVAVWLISVSVFQRGRGTCAYRDIELGRDEFPAARQSEGA